MLVGVIGLGIMGQSIGAHLLKSGYELIVYNRTKSKATQLVRSGAIWVDTPKKVAEQADIVFTIVGYPSDVEQVYFGKEGLFNGYHERSLFIDMTTSSPTLAKKINKKARGLGIDSLDAPVTGGDLGAKEGTLSVLVGGNEESYARALPLFKTFGQNIHLFGSAGNGQHAKMMNQIMIAGTMLGLSEMLAYADGVNIEWSEIIGTIDSGAAANRSLDLYLPRMIKEDYTPGFFVKHFIKDLKIALDEAERMNINLPMTKLAYDLYQKLADLGNADDGTQAIIKLWK